MWGDSMKNIKLDNKDIVKMDKIDCYIKRYREDIRLQEELEEKRTKSFVNTIFKKLPS